MPTDYSIEQEVDAACTEAEKEKLRDLVWKTKDGREVAVRDMETSHLQNCIPFIERGVERAINRQLDELDSALGWINGEMAEMAIESDIAVNLAYLDNVSEYCETYLPIYNAMVQELGLRNVSLDR